MERFIVKAEDLLTAFLLLERDAMAQKGEVTSPPAATISISVHLVRLMSQIRSASV